MPRKTSFSRPTLKSDLALVDAPVAKAAQHRTHARVTAEMLPQAKIKRGGRPRSLNPKKLISIRLPADVVALEGNGSRLANAHG